MANTDISVSMREVAQRLTLNVCLVGVKTFRARVWLGTGFIKLGAWVIGCDIKLEPSRDDANQR